MANGFLLAQGHVLVELVIEIGVVNRREWRPELNAIVAQIWASPCVGLGKGLLNVARKEQAALSNGVGQTLPARSLSEELCQGDDGVLWRDLDLDETLHKELLQPMALQTLELQRGQWAEINRSILADVHCDLVAWDNRWDKSGR